MTYQVAESISFTCSSTNWFSESGIPAIGQLYKILAKAAGEEEEDDEEEEEEKRIKKNKNENENNSD